MYVVYVLIGAGLLSPSIFSHSRDEHYKSLTGNDR